MRRLISATALIGIVAAAIVLFGGGATAGPGDQNVLQEAAAGTLKPAIVSVSVTKNGSTTTVKKALPFVSAAAIVAEQQALCATHKLRNCDERLAAADGDVANPGVDTGTGTGVGPHTLGCGQRQSAMNVRVNQDCSFRRQAEEDITFNPVDPNNLAAGQNDSRVGFNQCGIDYSTSNGSAWGDLLPPFRQHLNLPEADAPNTITGLPGSAHTYDAASDPVNAFDSSGNAYFSCVIFDVFFAPSGLFVARSPAGAQGSFYFNVPAIGRGNIVVEDNDPNIFHDKNWIAADRYASSPNRDNVYATWTVFRFAEKCVSNDNPSGYCESPIYGSMSTDHARTWSKPQQISGSSSAVCSAPQFDKDLSSSSCNFDQGSNPVVLPNGDLEVIFNNGNTAKGNPNGQQLAVHCHPAGNSVSGTANLGCSAPVKVGNDIIVGEPQCDFGRGPEECIPGAYIRTNDYPRIVTENTQNNHLYAVWQDYRNGEFDIQMSQSLDGGLTWKEVGAVNPDRGLDHYFAAVDQSPSESDRVGVSYYRTERVPDENKTPPLGFAPCGDNGVLNTGASEDCQAGVGTGNSDYVLAGGTADQTPYTFKVVSPVFTPPDGIQSGFNGDYSGLTIPKGTEAHPIWSDTRNADPFAPANGVLHDEDIFTDNVGLPSGRGHSTVGKVGKS